MSKKSKPNVSISIDKAIVCFNGDKLATDASGNNAAFECPCPNCKHPVLLVIGTVNNRAISQTSRRMSAFVIRNMSWSEWLLTRFT